MKSKLGRALACAMLPAALVAAGVWLPGASADQPTTENQREFVSDTTGGATRTAVTGQCVRTSMPHAGAAIAGCIKAPAETAKAIAPAPPPQPWPAAEPTVAKAVPEPTPPEVAPAPPLEPVAEDHQAPPPVASEDKEVAEAVADAEASADSNQTEEIAATEAAMAPGAEAETAVAPVPAPEPPTDVAEAPAPAAPQSPPETSIAPPAPPAQPEPRRLRLAADTHFHFDRAQLTPAGQAELDKLVGEMGAAHIGAITIVGYTDRIGSSAYNQKLSQRRADAVRQYLAGRSVAPDRMQAVGRGKSDPVTAPDACKGLNRKRLIQCLAPDRRVEIEVVGLTTAAR